MAKTAVKIDSVTASHVNEWLQGDFDDATKQEVQRLEAEDPGGLVDAFYRKLSFGTGGLRGVMGVGCNRINNYTIRAATQGLANYLKAQGKRSLKVLIGYDSRQHSDEFALQTARVLAFNEIDAFIFKALRPVPLVSFGCVHSQADAAVMITASHNPREYNGYKVYWSHGGQVLPPHDSGIVQQVARITDPSCVQLAPENHPRIHWIDEELDEAYLKATHALQTLSTQNQAHGHQLKIAYTALHGAGITLVPKALASWGFTDLHLVHPQNIPDGRFPTVKSPNPEEPEALHLGLQTLEKYKADLLIATDPDTDRLGVAVRHGDGVQLLDGNQVASLCVAHLCRHRPLSSKSAFVKTIVTTDLFKAIAKRHGAACFEVLTGFKYIGELIHEWKQSGEYEFIFGAEESYGALLGTHACDKDAIVTANLVCEMALDAKLRGKTLVDELEALYQEYGIYREILHSPTYTGKQGADRIQNIMTALRKKFPSAIGGTPIISIEDYLTGQALDIASRQKTALALPKSNVLLYRLADGSKVIIRPSGTEPKMKLYCSVSIKNYSSMSEGIEAANRRAAHLLQGLERLF